MYFVARPGEPSTLTAIRGSGYLVFSFVTASEGYDSTHPILLLLKKNVLRNDTTPISYGIFGIGARNSRHSDISKQWRKKLQFFFAISRKYFWHRRVTFLRKLSPIFLPRQHTEWLRQYPWIFECFFQLKFNFYEPSLLALVDC